MKSIHLISIALLVAIALSNNLSAGPVYAAKWERMLEDGSKQEVLLYGDHHETHEADEELEPQAIDAFCEELKSVKAKTIVLCEDFNSTIFSDQDYQGFYDDWNKSFITAACNFAYEISKSADSLVKAQSIDPRSELFELTEMAILHMRNFYGYCKPIDIDHKPYYKKAYDAMKDEKVVDIFERVITNVEFLTDSAHDDQSKEIFDEIITTFQKRKEFWLGEIMKTYKLTMDELNQITIDDIGKMTAKISLGLLDLSNIDKFMQYGVKLHYCLEVVEANALWHITNAQKQYQRIVVIAGWFHVRNLEKYLSRLGFEQCCIATQDYNFASEALEDAEWHFYNVYYPNHKLRVSPLDPFDKFCLSLFDHEIEAAFHEVGTLPDSSLSEELKQAYHDYEVASKEYKSFNPVPLVPFETFKWISESGETDEVESSWEDLERQPETKKRRIEESL